jgi:hypothetical protein
MGAVTAGDLVLSENPETGELALKPVLETFWRTSDHLRIVEFETADGERQQLRGTDEHPFWIPALHKDVPMGDLVIGQQVIAPNGALQTLVSTHREERAEGVEVVNFSVADFHRYFVFAKDGNGVPILVHNASYTPATNRTSGLSAQADFANRLRANGYDVVGESVLVRTMHGRREIDIVVRRNGRLFGIEVKSGNAIRVADQLLKDLAINRFGGEAFGRRARGFFINGSMIENILTVHVPPHGSPW